jgi:transcriptional regulator with XRE-family HTH domain
VGSDEYFYSSLTSILCGILFTICGYYLTTSGGTIVFGEYVKRLRLDKELSLREFARRIGEDPSNWSKVERGVVSPSRDAGKIALIAQTHGIVQNSEQWNFLEDYSSVDSATIPQYIMKDKQVLEALPAFFRTIGSLRPTTEEIEKLLQKLKKA